MQIFSSRFITFTIVCNSIHSAENAGKAVLAGGCLAGIGSLCYYGLGLSNELGAVDKARYKLF